MNNAERTALISVPVAILAGAALAWAGSQGGATVLGGIPLFAFCVGLAFLIQWLRPDLRQHHPPRRATRPRR
jgi:uncharacterized membrane protein